MIATQTYQIERLNMIMTKDVNGYCQAYGINQSVGRQDLLEQQAIEVIESSDCITKYLMKNKNNWGEWILDKSE